MRYVLVFVIGALFGANVAWYVARSRAVDCAPRVEAVAPAPASPAVVPAPSSAPSERPASAAATVATVATTVAPIATAGGLVLPVQGVAPSQLIDTYSQSRGEGRIHEAIDIMAPAGTPVLAAVDGPVAKLFTSKLGGLTIYQFDRDGRRVYYYAHLAGYAPGLAEGQVLQRGQVIGFVGSTGDASPAAPHLHFTVGDLGPEKRWWKSTPINPYPLLAR